jgi:hypothetical protein
MIDNFDTTKTSISDSFNFISITVSFIKQYFATALSIISYGFVLYSIFYIRQEEGKLKFSIPTSRKQIWKRLYQSYKIGSAKQLQNNFRQRWVQIAIYITVIVMILSFLGFVVTVLNSLYIFKLVNFIFYTLPILIYITIFILCIYGYNKLTAFWKKLKDFQKVVEVVEVVKKNTKHFSK